MIRTLSAAVAPVATPPSSASKSSTVGTLAGWATRYNTLTSDRGGFYLKIKPGAFGDSIKANASDIRALAGHNDNPINLLARLSAGTMRLTELSNGLMISIDLPDTSMGRDIWALAQRGDIDQLSVGMRSDPADESWAVEGDGKAKKSVLEIKRATLLETSVVVWPAISSATFAPQGSAPGGLSAKPKPAGTRNDLERIRAAIRQNEEFHKRRTYR